MYVSYMQGRQNSHLYYFGDPVCTLQLYSVQLHLIQCFSLLLTICLAKSLQQSKYQSLNYWPYFF